MTKLNIKEIEGAVNTKASIRSLEEVNEANRRLNILCVAKDTLFEEVRDHYTDDTPDAILAGWMALNEVMENLIASEADLYGKTVLGYTPNTNK